MRIEKVQLLNDIGSTLKGSEYLFLVNYKGLNVSDFTEFRKNLSDVNAQCCVLKNRLIKKAASEAGIDKLANASIVGETALISGTGDSCAVAKVISEFGKKCKDVSPKLGYFEGELLSVDEVNALAALPPREVLLSQLLGVLEAPARNLVGVLNTKASEIINVINAYKNKLEEN
jgi:large subunit ribosomal protein L10